MTKQEVLNYLDNVLHPIVSPNNWNVYSELYDMIEELPPAEPVRHGKWIDGHCSICGCDVPAYIIDWKWQKDMNAKFCPMCGARMDGAEPKE